MGADAIVLDHVTKRYGTKEALRGASLTVPAGSVVGLLGKNGAGKSTLIKCALGLASATSGRIAVLGEDPRAWSEATKARIGYAPQQPALYGWMRVGQLSDYTAAFYPGWNRALVSRLIEQWELLPSDRIATLSVGQAQKLSIILALGHEPDLLVLDEPAAGLDPVARRQFLQAVLDVAVAGGRTVLFSTHLTADLERVADRVAIMKDGAIAYAGELGELKDGIKRLRITGDSLPAGFAATGQLSLRRDEGHAVLTMRGFTPDAAQRIRDDFGADVIVDDLNLEEIFLEFHP
jgi:ABC-2 type transport system ATP-binding protein